MTTPLSPGLRTVLAGLPFVLIAGLAVEAQAQQFQHQVGMLPGTPRWTEGVEAADVDNDGDLDLFFAEGDGFNAPGVKRQNILIINNLETQVGLFTDESVARLGVSISHARQVITGDIQGDGWIDALFCNGFNTDIPFLFVNQGAANPGFFTNESLTRGLTTVINSASGSFGDLNNNGFLDLILNDSGPSVFGGAGGRPRLYINDGAGFFTEEPTKLNAPIKVSQMDVKFADINNTWALDFFGVCRAANPGGQHYLMLNDGLANFTNASGLLPVTSNNVYEAEVADLDNDGDVDFFFVSLSGFAEGAVRNELIPSGTLSFTALPAFSTHDDNEIALLDFDNDGLLDVIVGSLGSNGEKLFRNLGNMNFTQVAGAFTGLTDPTLDITVADLTNNGAYDVVTGQGETTNPALLVNKVYFNTGSPDTLPPVILREEALTGATQVGPWVVRAHVQDQVMDDGKNWVTGTGYYVVNTAPSLAVLPITGPSFAPLTIPAGTTVTWQNQDSTAHTVTSTTNGYGFASNPINPGGIFRVTFVREGVYTYECTLTPGMTGTVTVTGTASSARVTYSGGGIYRSEMTDTTGGKGFELLYEMHFTDWPGNLTVSPAKRVVLPGRPCGYAQYGIGVSPTNDRDLSGNGLPQIGGQIDLFVADTTGAPVFLAASFASGAIPFFGGVVLIDVPGYFANFSMFPVAGGARSLFPIPNDPAFVGNALYFQAILPDFSKPEGLALSNGLEMIFCP